MTKQPKTTPIAPRGWLSYHTYMDSRTGFLGCLKKHGFPSAFRPHRTLVKCSPQPQGQVTCTTSTTRPFRKFLALLAPKPTSVKQAKKLKVWKLTLHPVCTREAQAIWIRRRGENTLNKDDGAYELQNIYDQLVQTTPTTLSVHQKRE